jgi:NAD(P)-dependent dehydrogenase (short-subunit alcohol dehydrogenase family)
MAMTVQRSVLVTGCSSGFGLETATLLATRGWRVFAGLRDPDKRGDLDASVAMAGAPDDALEVVQLDVTDAASIDRAAKQVLVATGGALDAVVHNAGVSSAGYLEDIPVEEYRRVLETNFFGVVQLTAAVVPAMRERGSGRVVVISSNSAHLPMPLLGPYTASKWAVEGWAEIAAFELAPFGIEVLVVVPGAHRGTALGQNFRVFHPEGSVFAPWFGGVMTGLGKIGRAQGDPTAVAAHLAAVLEAPRPRFRTQVGWDAAEADEEGRTKSFAQRARKIRRLTGLPANKADG